MLRQLLLGRNKKRPAVQPVCELHEIAPKCSRGETLEEKLDRITNERDQLKKDVEHYKALIKQIGAPNRIKQTLSRKDQSIKNWRSK